MVPIEIKKVFNGYILAWEETEVYSDFEQVVARLRELLAEGYGLIRGNFLPNGNFRVTGVEKTP